MPKRVAVAAKASGGGGAAGDTPACWNELDDFFYSMDRSELLILLGKAWKSDDIRQTLTNGLTGTWTNAGDQNVLLNYDWALAPGDTAYTPPKTIRLNRTKSGKAKVDLPGYAGNWALEMETIRDMETLDGDAFEYGDDKMGCGECEAPDSSIRLELQKNRAEDLRLCVVATCSCLCNTMYHQRRKRRTRSVSTCRCRAASPRRRNREV